VRADKVLLATDGYTDDLCPPLRTSVVPIFSAITATAPLPDELCSRIVPGKHAVYESGNITLYYRRDGSNRLLVGGRGPQHNALDREDYRHLVGYALELWPALRQVEWTHWWNGQFAVTRDFYPRFHIPEPDLYVMLGYSGRGLALSSALGAELASVLTGAAVESFALPVSPVRSMRLHRFWRLGVNARVLYGRLLDRWGR
jgi:glycine/D-amino acid oxidase-like deaminating enzyme